MGAGETEEARISRLTGGLVFADGFSQFGFGRGDIQNIVDDLEGEPEGLAEAGEVAQGSGRGAGGHGAEAKRGGDEGAGFGAMNFDQFWQRNAFFFGIEIEDLAGNEAEAAGGTGKFLHHGSGGVTAVGSGAGDGGEGLG